MASKEHFDAGMLMIEASLAESRAEREAIESRVKRLQAAALLVGAGDLENAQAVLDRVRCEQEAAGI